MSNPTATATPPATEAAKAAPGRLQLTKVEAKFHLIVQPTKDFDDTDPDRVVIMSNNQETTVHVMNPFEVVPVLSPDNTKSPVKLPGFFRACLFPALRVLQEFNQATAAGIMRIGNAKETDQLYKDIAFNLLNKIEAAMPNVSNLFNKTVMVNKVDEGDSSFTWTIDVYAFYKYKGAMVEDITPHFNTILNTIAGVDSKGKPSKSGAEKNTGLSLSIGVDLLDGYMLSNPEVDLSSFTFSTTHGTSKYCPSTKSGRVALFGQRNDQPLPLMLFTKEVSE